MIRDKELNSTPRDVEVHIASEIICNVRTCIEGRPVREDANTEWFGPLPAPFEHLYVVRFKRKPEISPPNSLKLPPEEFGIAYLMPLQEL